MQLQNNSMPLQLLHWFVQGHYATLKKVTYLEHFTAYILPPTTSVNSVMNLIKETFINRKGNHHIHHQWFWYVLHLRYTSLQVYSLILEKFPMASLSLSNKIQQGSVEALKTLYEKGFFFHDCILMKCGCKNLHSNSLESM